MRLSAYSTLQKEALVHYASLHLHEENNILPIELEQLVQGTACNCRLFPWDHPQRRDVSCRVPT